MNAMSSRYRVLFSESPAGESRELCSGRNARIDEDGFAEGLSAYLRPLERDLLRIGMAVYVVDRIVKRVGRAKTQGLTRTLSLQIVVSDPEFWGNHANLISNALRQLSDDFWNFRFLPGTGSITALPLFSSHRTAPRICLYSGGLDSAGGLARRLRECTDPFISVTACHQPGQWKRVRDQLDLMKRRYGRELSPLIIRTALINPPLMKHQEVSQRCRAFLFATIGGAVASLCGSPSVEVYESGVGALNLPTMAGMISGGRATRGCHPQFLRLMSDLVSHVAERPIRFGLPFKTMTKAQVVTALAEDGLSHLASETVSCVHFPMREKGAATQCGICMGCIGRRQAILVGGVAEREEQYKYDLFRCADKANTIPADKLMSLKAILFQVADLVELSDDGQKPDLFRRYMFGTGVLAGNEPVRPWVEVIRRYRDEWRLLLAETSARGVTWPCLFSELAV